MQETKPKLTIEGTVQDAGKSQGADVVEPNGATQNSVAQNSNQATDSAAQNSNQATDSAAQNTSHVQNSAQNVASKKTCPFESVKGWVARSFPHQEHAFWGGVLGLLVALLIFWIGFLKSLFVIICVVIGVAIGQYIDGNPVVVRAVRKFFGDNS